MGFLDRKIQDTDITSKGVVAAPDVMTGTAQENKMVFDRLIREKIKDYFNGLIDDLVASTAAALIGFAATTAIPKNTIQEAIEYCYSTGQGAVATALEYALKAEGYAVGKQNGEDVTSESPYYHANAKYYSEQASGSASSASGSATSAEASKVAAAGSESNAANSASAASGSEGRASDSATAAAGSATEANGYKVAAAGSAETATTKAQEALNSATNAAGSATNADQSRQQAEAAAANAQSWAAQVHYPVSYGEDQSAVIDDTGKARARTNIGAEASVNKTTEVSESSTDTQYPSAKAVRDDVYTPLNTAIGALNEDKADKTALNKYMGGGWNQLIANGNFESTSGWTTYLGSLTVSGNVANFTSSYAGSSCYQDIQAISGHKYFISAFAKNNGANTAYFSISGSAFDKTFSITSSSWVNFADILTASTSGVGRFIFLGGNPCDISFKNCRITDLTALGLDSITTVAQFRALYSADYYPFSLPFINNTDNEYMITMDGFISPTINGIKNYWDGSLYHRRIARVDLGSLNWTNIGYQSYQFYVDVNYIKTPSDNNGIANMVCLKYQTASYNGGVNGKIVLSSGGRLMIYDTNYSDVNSFKQAVSGTFLYYELATEQTCNIDANGLRFDLLWENASPSASFGAQTVSLNLWNYRFVYIVYRKIIDSAAYAFALINKGMLFTCVSEYDSGKTIARTAKATDNGVEFQTGLFAHSYGSFNEDNTCLVPYQIYGVR